MVAIAVSFVIVDRCLRVSRSCSWLSSGQVGTGVQPLEGENYKLATYSVMYNFDPVSCHRVVLLIFYLPLVHLPTWIAVDVRGVGVLTLPWWVMLSSRYE